MDGRMKGARKIHIIQGEYKVVTAPDIVLSTVLGSCVAACLRDPVAGIGGMNHFLLPGDKTSRHSQEAERYGAYLMELLINELLKSGAQRYRLEAKLFGGARMLEGLSDIGAQNAAFAKEFLSMESIPIVAEHLGGTHGRRVEFFPTSGRVRQILLPHRERVADFQTVPKLRGSGCGELELF